MMTERGRQGDLETRRMSKLTLLLLFPVSLSSCLLTSLTHISFQQLKGFSFARAGGFVDDHPQSLELYENFFRWDQVQPCREDRAFEDCVFGPVEAEKISDPPAVHHPRH